MRCDFCSRTTLDEAYTVPSSKMGATVMLCTYCGLVQSRFEKTTNPRGRGSLSSGADFGNVRYGKGFRTLQHLRILDEHLDWSQIRSILDIGSNRGSFVEAVAARSDAKICAVEPDALISPDYKNLPNVTLLTNKIERVDLTGQHFDLVYASHTFEHLDSLRSVLASVAAAVPVGAYLLAEVPNLAYLATPDLVEEWFIDAHTLHFSRMIFRHYLAAYGWKILYENNEEEKDVITVLAQFSGERAADIVADSSTVADARTLLQAYGENQKRNVQKMRSIARAIESFAPKRIALWGAGRICNAVVEKGKLDLAHIDTLIDSYLPKYVPQLYGKRILLPEEAKLGEFEVIVLLTRNYADEIEREARRLGFTGDFLTYHVLWENAVRSSL